MKFVALTVLVFVLSSSLLYDSEAGPVEAAVHSQTKMRDLQGSRNAADMAEANEEDEGARCPPGYWCR